MSGPTLDGRYRLAELVRPNVDESTWRGEHLVDGRRVLVCLVDDSVRAACESRANVSHPRLVPILDMFGRGQLQATTLPGLHVAGTGFVILDEPPLPALEDEIAEHGAMPMSHGVRLVKGLAETLLSLNRLGALHGCINPASVLVDPRQQAHLSLRGVHDEAVAYMSGQRLVEDVLSPQDDAWALLGVLYFAVTGAPPFTGPSRQALARRILGGGAAPIANQNEGAPELQDIFNRGFSRVAGHRFPDVAALDQALADWLGTFGEATTMPPPADAQPSERITDPGPGEPSAADHPSETMRVSKADLVDPNTGGTAEETVRFSREQVADLLGTPPPGDVREPAPSQALTPPRGMLAAKQAKEMRVTAPPQQPLVPEPNLAPALATDSDPPPAGSNDITPPAPEARDKLPSTSGEIATDLPEFAPAVPPGAPTATQPTPEPSADDSGALSGRSAQVVPNDVPPPPPKGSSTLKMVAIALVAFVVVGSVGGAAIVFGPWSKGAKGGTGASKPPPSKNAAKPAPTKPSPAKSAAANPSNSPAASAAPKAPSSATPAASASAAPSASSSAGAASPPKATPSGEGGACVMSVFPANSFKPDADLGFVCGEGDPRKGGLTLRARLVEGGGALKGNHSARYWSAMGWFQPVMYAVLRQQCCRSPSLSLGTKDAPCPALPPLMEEMATRAQANDSIKLGETILQYRKAVACVSAGGNTTAYGIRGGISGGQEPSFRLMLKSLRPKKPLAPWVFQRFAKLRLWQ